jgi:uncharacterized DUF497 family protein
VKVVWDPVKDLANQRKHRVSFRQASELFTSGIDYLELFDDEHSEAEDRFIAIGPIRRGLVLVIWTELDEDTVRIISARWAKKREQLLYREYKETRL